MISYAKIYILAATPEDLCGAIRAVYVDKAEKTALERIQKTACHIILGQSYDSYTAQWAK